MMAGEGMRTSTVHLIVQQGHESQTVKEWMSCESNSVDGFLSQGKQTPQDVSRLQRNWEPGTRKSTDKGVIIALMSEHQAPELEERVPP
jgi:hypothetical protein